MLYSFGASFNPEHWILKNDQSLAQKAFELLINELGILDLRLAVRSSEVLKEGKIDLSYYDPYMQLALKNHSKICLNVGPIKTMRWPEETISKQILNKLREIPDHGATIYKDSELAKLSLGYLDNLLKLLKDQYGDSFPTFQANNEGFNHFGQYGWVMDPEFEKQCIELINSYFPNGQIMLSSSGLDDVKKIMTVIDDIEQIRFIMGINYYYRTPGFPQSRFLFRNRDNLSKNLVNISIKDLSQMAQEKNFTVEISEFQFEPWEGLDAPGNDYNEFIQKLDRIRKLVRNIKQETFVIRLWGIEQLLVKMISNELTEDHKKIIKLLQE